MKYRDDLEAAQHRIRELENQVAELNAKGSKGEPETPALASSPTEEAVDGAHGRKSGPGAGCFLFSGGAGLVLFLLLLVFGSTRACVACDSAVTDPALAALNKCPAAVDALGKDIGWSMLGCSNYEGESGGDPFNQGCHSSGMYQMPVAGSKARGSYTFHTGSLPGKPNRFTGGRLWVPDGRNISISADGPCQ